MWQSIFYKLFSELNHKTYINHVRDLRIQHSHIKAEKMAAIS